MFTSFHLITTREPVWPENDYLMVMLVVHSIISHLYVLSTSESANTRKL